MKRDRSSRDRRCTGRAAYAVFPFANGARGSGLRTACFCGAARKELEAIRPDLIVMYDTDHLNILFLEFSGGCARSDQTHFKGRMTSRAWFRSTPSNRGRTSPRICGASASTADSTSRWHDVFVISAHVVMNFDVAGGKFRPGGIRPQSPRGLTGVLRRPVAGYDALQPWVRRTARPVSSI